MGNCRGQICLDLLICCLFAGQVQDIKRYKKLAFIKIIKDMSSAQKISAVYGIYIQVRTIYDQNIYSDRLDPT